MSMDASLQATNRGRLLWLDNDYQDLFCKRRQCIHTNQILPRAILQREIPVCDVCVGLGSGNYTAKRLLTYKDASIYTYGSM